MPPFPPRPTASRLALAGAVAFCFQPAALDSAFAQIAPTTTPPPSFSSSEPVKLSVFEVTAEQDRGHAASSAMSGTQTNEKLENLPNSISVAPRSPNLLFIIADDQSPFDLRAYDPASKLKTPHIDRLADVGRHGLQGKQNLYEHTWRVPDIVRGPGIKPGTRAPRKKHAFRVAPVRRHRASRTRRRATSVSPPVRPRCASTK